MRLPQKSWQRDAAHRRRTCYAGVLRAPRPLEARPVAERSTHDSARELLAPPGLSAAGGLVCAAPAPHGLPVGLPVGSELLASVHQGGVPQPTPSPRKRRARGPEDGAAFCGAKWTAKRVPRQWGDIFRGPLCKPRYGPWTGTCCAVRQQGCGELRVARRCRWPAPGQEARVGRI